ncbi:MAG: hypothetical protein Q9169_006222, partial [Polycauliona sp. 2 TL-2023]
MAGTIGRVMAAAVAAVNENQVSLINMNFDFTLMKFEAPKEFRGLGSMLSSKRKTSAESGTFHRTARKLGALFDGSLPDIQVLMKTYGIRVSEIAQSEKVKTSNTRASDLFAHQIGVDSTSIWAAVTSGEAAVSVHLLACMLARVFPGPAATSIWVEVVAEQKLQIQERQRAASYPSAYDAASMASRQEFSRDELAEWDNSARSWIQCGDRVMQRQHFAMMQMLESARISVNSETNTFKSVITAWIDALKAMTCLISGTPQRVQNGAILLGLSAWHLYPDLVLLSADNPQVRQHDPLIDNLGVLTVGLEDLSLPHDPVSWSLPLAYMRYYGEPKLITGLVGHSNSRITIDQFAYVVLGCVISSWERSGFVRDVRSALDILHIFAGFVKTLWTQGSRILSRQPHTTLIYQHLAGTSWLGQLFVATDRYRFCDDDVERYTALKLIAFGRRHGNFLCQETDHPAPLFGLSSFRHTFGLMKDTDQRVSFLRKLASSMGLSSDRYVIRYQNLVNSQTINEYTTIHPFDQGSDPVEGCVKRRSIVTNKNVRWLPLTDTHRYACECEGPCVVASVNVDDSKKRKAVQMCPCGRNGCSPMCHDWNGTIPSQCNCLYSHGLASRLAELASKDEYCLPVYQIEDYPNKRWIYDFGSGNAFDESVRELYASNQIRHSSTCVELAYCTGDVDSACIMAVGPSTMTECRPAKTRDKGTKRKIEHLGSYMDSNTLNLALDTKYYDILTLAHWLIEIRNLYPLYVSSLMACASAAEIYKLLPGATISTTILSQSIHKALWVPGTPAATRQPSSDYRHQLSKAQTFACIAMLDTGIFNFDLQGLDNVFAISSGNSIYIAGDMLCDPFEVGKQFEVRHVSGNIGRPGISLLVPPPDPKIRKLPAGTWAQLNYRAFDGKQEDSFSHTSIHLSFTAYEMPLRTGLTDQHIIDRPAQFVETLVSAYDGETWIGDLDIMKALHSDLNSRFACMPDSIVHNPFWKCNRETFSEAFSEDHDMVSVDNWEEFLDQSERSERV